MPVALKGTWTVRAGIIPGEPIQKFTKSWKYTSLHHEEDSKIDDPAIHAIFSKLRAEALDYYLQVSQPHLNNWAEMTFIWF